MSTASQHEFQAEVKQLLDLMIHSLYSNKDIFLRELISNASDALDRLRFEQITDQALQSDGAPEIRLEPDVQARTLTIHDNGIGMNRDEVIRHIGTIAKSGTKEFLENARKSGQAAEAIGQFGVGFYSSFMVADKVTLVTRRAGQAEAVRWESTGAAYTLEPAERASAGTSITLHLKASDEENHLRDYTNPSVLQEIVKKYSDFVGYPVKLKTWVEKDGAQVLEEKTLNSQKAIWARPKAEVTSEEYREFYRHISHDWREPLEHISVKIEGNFEAQALLYIPSHAPWDLYHPEMKRGVQLYVKRIFIMDECKELMPTHLRWIKGVVDAQDLSLNVSREILQQDRQIRVIKKQLVKKVYDTLENIRSEKLEQYRELWAQFGPALKEGLVGPEAHEHQRIHDLMLVRTTKNEAPITLATYVANMKEGQEAIYYLTGPSLDAVRRSPHLEAFAAKDYEVIYFVDPIDEIWLDRMPEFQGKTFRSVGQGDVNLGSAEEKAQAEKKREEDERNYRDLLTVLRSQLQEEIKEVRLSSRLTESLACLVSDTEDMSPQMVKLMRHMGQAVPKTKRILELNPNHALMAKLQTLVTADKSSAAIKDYAALIYGQALLAEGGQLADPAQFSRLVAEMMTRTL